MLMAIFNCLQRQMNHYWFRYSTGGEHIVGKLIGLHKRILSSMQPNLFHDAPASNFQGVVYPRILVSVKQLNRNFEDISKLCNDGALDYALETAEAIHQQGISISRNEAYSLLKGYDERKDLTCAKRVQSLIAHNGLGSVSALGDRLIRIFACHGRLEDANLAFKKVIRPSLYTWSSIILANTNLGQGGAAIELYNRMQASGVKADNYIYVAILKACAITKAILQGTRVHSKIIHCGIESDVVVGSSIVHMYCTWGLLVEAYKVFDRLPVRNVVIWSALIAGCAQHGQGLLALVCYERMYQDGIGPVEPTFSSALKACASIGAIEHGRLIHEKVMTASLYTDMILENTLVDMYAKCGRLNEAQHVFDNMQNRDVISWNALISCYAQHGECGLALECFDKMQQHGMTPNIVSWNAVIAGSAQNGEGFQALECFNKMQEAGMELNEITFLSVVKACANVGAIEEGRHIHDEIIKRGLFLYAALGNALVDLYAKCGDLEEAWKLFYCLPTRDVVTWGSMITAYAHQGMGFLTIDCFEKMQQHGIQPDKLSFTSILTVCGHEGLIDEGQWYFKSMRLLHGITPSIIHFICMVDLLGHAGWLSKTEEFIQANMQNDTMGWISLLSACRMHGNVEIGRRCFEKIAGLDSTCASGYVLMANAYADGCMHEDCSK